MSSVRKEAKGMFITSYSNADAQPQPLNRFKQTLYKKNNTDLAYVLRLTKNKHEADQGVLQKLRIGLKEVARDLPLFSS